MENFRGSLILELFVLLFYTINRVHCESHPNYESISESTNNPTNNQNLTMREYENESTNYMTIDDMIINKDSTRAGFVQYTWPNGIVPYTIQQRIVGKQRSNIIAAIKEIEEVTCIRFRNATEQDTYNIIFKKDRGGGCSAVVGWQNMRNQPVNLADVCSWGNVVHEIIHALGFFHEQTRDDRDKYVTVNFQNIQPGYEKNFQKDSELYPKDRLSNYSVPYNYDSIMHYGPNYFSKNDKNTIDVKKNIEGEIPPLGLPRNLGQRDFLSDGDILMLNDKYNCGL